MVSQDPISLDELDSIMNLQRQEAFDDEGMNKPRTRRNRSGSSHGSGRKSPSDNNNNNSRRRSKSNERTTVRESAQDKSAKVKLESNVDGTSSANPTGSDLSDRVARRRSRLDERRARSSSSDDFNRSITALVSPQRRNDRMNKSMVFDRSPYEGRRPSRSKRGSSCDSVGSLEDNRKSTLSSPRRRASLKSSSSTLGSQKDPVSGTSGTTTTRRRASMRREQSDPTRQAPTGGRDQRRSARRETTEESGRQQPQQQQPQRRVSRREGSPREPRKVERSPRPQRRASRNITEETSRQSRRASSRNISEESGQRKSKRDLMNDADKEFPNKKSSSNHRRSLPKDGRAKVSATESKRTSSEGASADGGPGDGDEGKKSFEQLWLEGETGSKRKERRSGLVSGPSPSQSDDDLEVTPLPAVPPLPPGEKPSQRKTKMEKIVELQAKYDRYKEELMQATREKRQLQRELRKNKSDAESLARDVESHRAEAQTLRKSLAETKQRMDALNEEHYLERIQFDETSKELAQARIDYTKSLNESRELREDLHKRDQDIEEKEKRISSLGKTVEGQMERADDLDHKLERAELEIRDLEDQMRLMEDELMTYRAAASKDEVNGDGENLKQAREEMERRLTMEREKRLDEKQKKLEQKQRDFEAERDKYLEREKIREEETLHREIKDKERQAEWEEERQRKDGEISSKLKELEDDNSALQARLKSEQLVSTDKMKKKDEAFAALQNEFAQVKKELQDRDADPNSTVSLQLEISAIRAEAECARDDLEDAQKQNGMFVEEIEELQAAKAELTDDIKALQKELAETKRQLADWQRKSEEWKNKASEWTEKTFRWKEKAEKWERTVRELDPSRVEDGNETKLGEAPEAAPQAMFLQAAMNRKRQVESNSRPTGAMGLLGGIFNKNSVDVEENEAEPRVKELEDANAKQLETIKQLRSEIVNLQAGFKEDAYNKEKRLQLLREENDSLGLKNTNLQKELALARKLGSVAAQDDEWPHL